MFEFMFDTNQPDATLQDLARNVVFQSHRELARRLEDLMTPDILASVEDDNITTDEVELDAYKNWDETLFCEDGGLVEEPIADDSAGALKKVGTSIDWMHGIEIGHIPNEELEELPFFLPLRKV